MIRSMRLAAAAVALVLAAPAHAGLELHVHGNRLVDGSGRPVRLLGVNRSGAEYACVQGWGIWDGPVDKRSIAAMKAWGINAVRVPLNEDCWLGNGVGPNLGGAAYHDAVEGYVARLHRAGLYAILDLHWSDGANGRATGQQPMPDARNSLTFWISVANTFKADPAVVFDLYNEPHDVSWSCWRYGCTTAGFDAAGMQALVNAVRLTGAAQPIMIGGLGWASDVSSWLGWAPVDSAGQLVASLHLYNFSGCHVRTCWNATIARVTRSVPVVTGELGENDCRHGFIDRYMRWADAHHVSYLAWTWDTWNCRSGPALIKDYRGTPTRFGIGFRDHLRMLRRR